MTTPVPTLTSVRASLYLTLCGRARLAQEILLTREPEVASYPPAIRLWTRLAAHSATLSRRGTTVLRDRFPT